MDSSSSFSSVITIRTRKVLRNPLLNRRQMVVDILHPNRPNISKADLRKRLSESYKVDTNTVSVFGLRTHHGGGKTTGFALIYDTHDDLRNFEPHYRLVRYAYAMKIVRPPRQHRSNFKNCRKKEHGTVKNVLKRKERKRARR